MEPSAAAVAAGAPIDVDISKIKPSARFEYRWDRKMTLELETGAEWETHSDNDDNDRLSYFLFMGYRKDFY